MTKEQQYRHLSLFIFGIYIEFCATHNVYLCIYCVFEAIEIVDGFNFNSARFVCRFNFNSQGYYGKKHATWELTVLWQSSTNFCLPKHFVERNKDRKTIENGYVIRATVWWWVGVCVCSRRVFILFIQRMNERERETLEQWAYLKYSFFIQNRHDCCLMN